MGGGGLFTVEQTGLARREAPRGSKVPVDADVDVNEIPADAQAEGGEQDLQLLELAVARLPIVEREVLTLFYLEELSLNEVAETLKVPVGTIKSRLFRARQMVRREMDV
jgi:RNA polymerase sigma-70 factor (ECF subfamily)